MRPAGPSPPGIASSGMIRSSWPTTATEQMAKAARFPATPTPADRAVARPAPSVGVDRSGRHGRDRYSPGRRTTEAGPPAWARSIASLASAIGHRVLGPRHVRRRPAVEPAERLARRGPQRDELGVLDPPAAGQLLDDQLRIEQEVDLARAQLRARSSARTTPVYSATLLVWTPEVLRDRGVRDAPRCRGHRPAQVDTAPRPARPGPGCRAPRRRSG